MAMVAPQMETQTNYQTNTSRCIMLAGKQLILATKAFAKEDRRKSWMVLISTFLLLIAVLAYTFLVPYALAKLAGSVLLGLVMVRAFIIYHDYLHHTILNKSTTANI